MKFSGWPWLGALLLMTSCSPLRERVVGEITSFGEEDAITVPASVDQGEPFEVTVITAGGGCMEQGNAEVKV